MSDGTFTFPLRSTDPDSPALNKLKLYGKTDKEFYVRDADGKVSAFRGKDGIVVPVEFTMDYRYTDDKQQPDPATDGEKDLIYILKNATGNKYRVVAPQTGGGVTVVGSLMYWMNKYYKDQLPLPVISAGSVVSYYLIKTALDVALVNTGQFDFYMDPVLFGQADIFDDLATNFPLTGGKSTAKFKIGIIYSRDGLNAYPNIARIFPGTFKRTNHTEWPSPTVQASQRYVNITASTKSGVDWQLVFLSLTDLIDFFSVIEDADGWFAVQLEDRRPYYRIVNVNQQGFGTGRFSVDISFEQFNSEEDIFADLSKFLPVTNNVSTATFQLKSTIPAVSFPLMEDYPPTNYKSPGSWENQSETDYNATTSYNADPSYNSPFTSRAGKFSATYDAATKRYTFKIARHSQHASGTIESRDNFLKNIKPGSFLRGDYSSSTSEGNETFIVISASFDSEANPVYTFVTERVRVKGNKAPIGNWVLSPAVSNTTELTQSDRSPAQIVTDVESLPLTNRLDIDELKNLPLLIDEIHPDLEVFGDTELINAKDYDNYDVPPEGSYAFDIFDITPEGLAIVINSAVFKASSVYLSGPNAGKANHANTGITAATFTGIDSIVGAAYNPANSTWYVIADDTTEGYLLFKWVITSSYTLTAVSVTTNNLNVISVQSVVFQGLVRIGTKYYTAVKIDGNGPQLHTVNLATGVATRVATGNTDGRYFGIPVAVIPTAQFDTYLGVSQGRLVFFNIPKTSGNEIYGGTFEIDPATGDWTRRLRSSINYDAANYNFKGCADYNGETYAISDNTDAKKRNLYKTRARIRDISVRGGTAYRDSLLTQIGYSLPTTGALGQEFYLINDDSLNKKGIYVYSATGWARQALASEIPPSLYDATYSKVAVIVGGTNQGVLATPGSTAGKGVLNSFTVVAFADSTAADIARQSQGSTSNYNPVTIIEDKRNLIPTSGHHFILTGTNINTYLVPTGQAGTYMVTGFFRVSDSSSFDSDAAEKTLGIGIHASSSDNPGFLWSETRIQSRKRLNYTRVVRLNEGEHLRMFFWTNGPADVNSFEWAVWRIG